MPTYTSNYSYIKPNVNDAVDEDLWGGYQNTSFDSIDSDMKRAMDSLVNAQSTAYTVLTSDRNKTITVDATSSAITVTLLAAATAGAGFRVTVKKIDSTANPVIVDGNSTETIDGSTTYILVSQYQSVSLVCDGSNWHVISRVFTPVPVIVNRAYAETTANTTFGATLPIDNTIPQITEGTQVLSATITPLSTTNRIRATVTVFAGLQSGALNNLLASALFNASSTNAIGGGVAGINALNDCVSTVYTIEHVPASTSVQTYSVRVGVAAGTGILNALGGAGGALFGGVMKSTLVLEELTA